MLQQGQHLYLDPELEDPFQLKEFSNKIVSVLYIS